MRSVYDIKTFFTIRSEEIKMFEKITPEQAGISSKSVQRFIEKLEKRGASTHGILFMKGDKIFTEAFLEEYQGKLLAKKER